MELNKFLYNRDTLIQKYFYLYYSVIARIKEDDDEITKEDTNQLYLLMQKSLAICKNKVDIFSNKIDCDLYNSKSLLHL